MFMNNWQIFLNKKNSFRLLLHSKLIEFIGNGNKLSKEHVDNQKEGKCRKKILLKYCLTVTVCNYRRFHAHFVLIHLEKLWLWKQMNEKLQLTLIFAKKKTAFLIIDFFIVCFSSILMNRRLLVLFFFFRLFTDQKANSFEYLFQVPTRINELVIFATIFLI